MIYDKILEKIIHGCFGQIQSSVASKSNWILYFLPLSAISNVHIEIVQGKKRLWTPRLQ